LTLWRSGRYTFAVGSPGQAAGRSKYEGLLMSLSHLIHALDRVARAAFVVVAIEWLGTSSPAFGPALCRADDAIELPAYELMDFVPSYENAVPRAAVNFEPFGAEEARAHDDKPHIPEPLVFDLVRPLGASRGEWEINVLTIAPLNRRVGLANELSDSIGLTPRLNERHQTEWAPEIEFAIADGLAFEFELPFEENRLAAYKMAGQWTFGTAMDDQFIHGTQGIMLYDRGTGRWSPTVLYLAGYRFDEVWSTLLMLGIRSEINSDDVAERTERLFNWSLFADVGPRTTLGVETNFAESLQGPSAWLLMPQLHWEITDHWMVQSGVGARFSKDYTLPEAALRMIRSF